MLIDGHYLVGWSMLSSLISCYRDPFVEVANHKLELTALYQDCCRIYFSTKEYIRKHKLSKIYVFNGRLSYTKAILDAANAMSIYCAVHERGATFKKYSLFTNHTVHNISKITECVIKSWNDQTDLVKRKEIGSLFYENRKNNIIGSWAGFLDLQDPTLLPLNWDSKKHNVVL
ncbi:MAG: hypothetical protein IPL10_13625 [Bacteroidetes bacterium]|nr:hypothetical protein [Bacteroidota bacterium]